LNRRRFLKYAGATAGVIGASALGLDYLVRNPQIPSQQATQTQIPPSSNLATASVSSSSSTLVSLQGRLFFDYNGNGIQEADEPSVQNARLQMLQIRNLASEQVIAEVLTDSSGDYEVDVPAGEYKLLVQPDNSKPDNPNFGYMCTSPSEFRTITSGYYLTVVRDGRFNFGLMEGPFTMPFRSSTHYSVACYYNWDSTSKETRGSHYLWWNGESGSNTDLLLYNNAGIDMPMDVGQDVLAPAPGIMGDLQRGPEGQLGVSIVHDESYLGGLFGTFFNHLSEVLLPVQARVARGDIIARSGTSGTTIPHLHVNNWVKDTPTQMRGTAYLDFYEPKFEITSKTSGYWYPDEFTWHSVPIGTSPNGRNLWTRLNKPVFFR
jgi:murein DD-endopeptidase MepM/ murein hydrolase activator NlpD